MKSFIVTLAAVSFVALNGSGASEHRLTRSQYIDMWKDEAIAQMVEHRIPASITLAQGILESGDGNSELARKSNNHFGIKCHSDWTGGRVYHDDDKKGECFRRYTDASESYHDHSLFLQKKRYAELFELKITDYKGWAKGLKKCGYATARTYATMLIQLIESNDLTRYDAVGLEMIEQGQKPERKARKKREEEAPIVERKSKGDDELPEVHWARNRSHGTSDNRVRYILAEAGESPESIAKDLDVMPWQILRYNDVTADYRFAAGELVYVQPKRNRCKTDVHVVKEGETLRSISQYYGLKLRKIARRNGLEETAEVPEGTKLQLNRTSR